MRSRQLKTKNQVSWFYFRWHRSWEISTENFLGFPGALKKQVCRNKCTFLSTASEIKKIQHTLETWKVNFDSTTRQPILLSYAWSCLQYITNEELTVFKAVQVLLQYNYHEWYNYNVKSQSLTKRFLWVKLTEWAELWGIHLLEEFKMQASRPMKKDQVCQTHQPNCSADDHLQYLSWEIWLIIPEIVKFSSHFSL